VKTSISRFRSVVALLAFAGCSMIHGTGHAQPAPSPAPTPSIEVPTAAATPPDVSTPAASPAPPAPSPPPARSHGNTAAWITAGLAVAGAATGTVLGIVALGDKSDFQKHPTYDKANAGNDSAAYCDAAFGAAVVLGVTSVILFLAHDDAPPATASRATLTASPVVTPHGAGLGAVLRF
jgi:hypothetical protein